MQLLATYQSIKTILTKLKYLTIIPIIEHLLILIEQNNVCFITIFLYNKLIENLPYFMLYLCIVNVNLAIIKKHERYHKNFVY